MKRLKRLDLQAKISLVLVGVILPTFLIVTVAENQLTQPILEEELRQIGITSGKTLAAEIVSQRILTLTNPTPQIESHLQELLYLQPNIVRMDVVVKDPLSKDPAVGKVIATNIEEDPSLPPPPFPLTENLTSELKPDENGINTWELNVPIEQKGRDPRSIKKFLGTVHVVVSMKFVSRIIHTLWRITASAAAFSVVLLLFVLSYFLRKTIANDRKLRRAESQNIQLTEQLHEVQRELMNTEKLAVMGQLTASFAHEIGTPLNAIGGHLQLLKEEISPEHHGESTERIGIIDGQLSKIEGIVKTFLQSTSKPSSQNQLVDLNRLADQTLGIVAPRIESMRLEVKRKFDREMGPIRAVPLDIEQILLNLVNNSLDSLKAKAQGIDHERLVLEMSTQVSYDQGKEWAEVTVYDTGEGIKKTDLLNVLKPFFTTKRPGEGTGLGLTICQQLARKYGGHLEVDSKEGTWARVKLRIPYVG